MCWRNCSLKLSAYFSTIFLISLNLCSGMPGCPPRCYQHRGTSLLGQFHAGLQPVLGLMAAADDVDVHPLLLVGVYLERVFALASEYWTHNLLLLPVKAAVKRGPLSMLIWPSVSSLAAFTPQRYKTFPKQIPFPLKKLTNRHEKGRGKSWPRRHPRPIPQVVAQAFSCLYHVHHVVG